MDELVLHDELGYGDELDSLHGGVAEGIENQDQVDRLGELGCDFGQGYFIGKPMSSKQVNDALAGLPYAQTAGRTAITWLWERAIKDPPPEPALRRVTAKDVVRHPLVARIVEAYDARDGRQNHES